MQCSKRQLYPTTLSDFGATTSFGASTILGRRIMKVDPRPGSLSTSDSKWCVFETVHISAHVIYAMLTEKALNPFVECTSGLVS
jgi:hypothetical protein